jgi:hypothetical protein
MGRNGLYPEEEVFVHRWWKDRILNESSAQESSREAESKRQISDLRLRETQLQILFFLGLAFFDVPCSPFTSFSLLVLFFSAEAMAISNTMTKM